MFRTERRIIIFNYENILNKLGKDKILIVILAGILLMVISIPVKDRQTVSENTTSNQESGEATQKMYEEYVEKRLEDTLSDVEGAGKVKVMVSLKNSSERYLPRIQIILMKKLMGIMMRIPIVRKKQRHTFFMIQLMVIRHM